MARVLIAPDKFKGSLTAVEVAEAVRRGLLVGSGDREQHEICCLPVADGGDGTVDAAVAAGYDRVEVEATGPLGRTLAASWARRGDTAIVEMAEVSGLARLAESERDAMAATSRGTGELVAAALDAGVSRIVLGIGGSASTDGGAGMLQALGARLLDGAGRDIGHGGAALADLARMDLGGLHPRLSEVDVVVACDVDNPLTGPHGAAATYGPQKGARPDQVQLLDQHLGHLADVVATETSRDHRGAAGAGAAGGVGFAALALLDARLEPGIELLLDLLGFDAHLQGTDLVVVGEGSLDAQSLRGKAPVGVARRARAAGATVVAVCGVSGLRPAQLETAGIAAAYSLAELEPNPATCMREAGRLLEELAGRELARHLSSSATASGPGSPGPPAGAPRPPAGRP